MSSGLPLKGDIARCSWHVANVPEPEVAYAGKIRDVEHHVVLLMMSKNTGKIVPGVCVRPCFDNRFDLTFCRSALLRRGSRSDCLPMYAPRTNVRVHVRHAE